MFRKKPSPAVMPDDLLKESLAYLYLRRIAVNNLLRSLEAYDASRMKSEVQPPRRAALRATSWRESLAS